MKGGVLHLDLGIISCHNAISHIATDETVVESERGVAARSLNGGSLLTGDGIVMEDTVLHINIHCSSWSVAQEKGGALRGSAVGYHTVAYLNVFHRKVVITVDDGYARTSLQSEGGQHTARLGIGEVELQSIHNDVGRSMAHCDDMASVFGIVATSDVGSDARGISLRISLGDLSIFERRGETAIQSHMARQVYERRADIGQIGISRRCGCALLDKHLHGTGI